MKQTTTIQELAKNYSEFHPYVLVPFNKTSMTIPAVLYYAIATKHSNARKYFKETASRIKDEILESGVSPSQLCGKLSRKVQEVAWCEIIHNAKESDIDLTEFSAAKVIPYDSTTMTVPMFLYNQVLRKHNGNRRQTTKYIRERAEDIKADILNSVDMTQYELKGKISHKIQENLWLEFIPERVQTMPVERIG